MIFFGVTMRVFFIVYYDEDLTGYIVYIFIYIIIYNCSGSVSVYDRWYYAVTWPVVLKPFTLL